MHKILIILLYIKCYLIVRTKSNTNSCESDAFWPTTPNNFCTTSSPICVDQSYKPLTRCCTNDQFEDPPACPLTQEPITTPCPENFEQIQDTCILLLANSTYPPNCPFEQPLPFNDYINYVSEFPIWMPITRRTHSIFKYGLLYWMEFGDNYMKVFKTCEPVEDLCEDYAFSDSIIGKDCLIYFNSSYVEAVSCEERHTAICAYATLTTVEKSYCEINDINCKQSDYSTRSSCFCVSELNESKVGAEFLQPYQNLLYPEGAYQIGLELSGDEFQWANSKLRLNYSNWDAINESKDGNNVHPIMKDGKWVLVEDINVYSNSLTVEEITGASNTLELQYIEAGNYLKVSILHPNNYLQLKDEDGPEVHCFTDANPVAIISEVMLFKLQETIDTISYKINPYTAGPGSYWCEAFAFPSLDVTRTDEIFVRSPDSKSEYIGIFSINFVPKLNVLTYFYINFLERVLYLSLVEKSSIGEIVPRIFGLLDIDENTSTVIFNAHFSLASTGAKVPEFLALRELIEEICAENYTIIEFRSVDECMEVTEDGVTWPMTNVGSSAYPLNGLCLDANNSFVKRDCVGDFIDGAKWSALAPCTFYWSSTETMELVGVLEEDDGFAFHLKTILDESYPDDLSALDVEVISTIFGRIVEVGEVPPMSQILVALFELSQVSEEILVEAQSEFRALEEIFERYNEISKLAENNVCVKETSIFMSFLESSTYGFKFSNIEDIEVIYNNSYSLENAEEKTTLLLSEELFSQLSNNEEKLVATIYFTDYLFVPKSRYEEIYDIFQIVTDKNTSEYTFSVFFHVVFIRPELHYRCASWSYEANWTSIKKPSIISPTILLCDFKPNSPVTLIATKNVLYNLTDSLLGILASSESLAEKLEVFYEVSTQFAILTAEQMSLVAKVLQKLADTEDICEDNLNIGTQIISNLINVSPKVLQSAQCLYSSSDKILHYFGKLFLKCVEPRTIVQSNFETSGTHLKDSEITGLLFDAYHMETLKGQFNISELKEAYPAFQTAIILSEELLEQLHQSAIDQTLVIAVYYKNSFFQESSDSTKVFRVLLPNFEEELKGNVSLYVNTLDPQYRICASWNYDLDAGVKGHWKNDGDNLYMDETSQCNFNHLNHFTLLFASTECMEVVEGNLTWPMTDSGFSAFPLEGLCLYANGTFAQRSCELEESGAKWSNFEGNCTLYEDSNETMKLMNVLEQPNGLGYHLNTVLENTHPSDLKSIDIYIMSDVFEKIADVEKTASMAHILYALDTLSQVAKDVLIETQSELKSVERVLKNYEVIAKAEEVDWVSETYSFFSFLPREVFGVEISDAVHLLYNSSHSYGNFTEGFKSGVLLSEELFNQLYNHQQKVVTTVFLTNGLFATKEKLDESFEIFQILLAKETATTQKFSLFYNVTSVRPDVNYECAFWDYKEDPSGIWKISALPKTIDGVLQCDFATSSPATLITTKNYTFNLTESLLEILEATSTKTLEEKLKIFYQVSTAYTRLTPEDIQLVSEVFKMFSQTEVNLMSVTGIVENLLNVPKSVMQDAHNATDQIVGYIDEVAKHSDYLQLKQLTKKFTYFICEGVDNLKNGIVFEAFGDTIRLSRLSSHQNFTDENFLAAILFDEELEVLDDLIFAITLYANDVLFNDRSYRSKNVSTIFGLTLKDYLASENVTFFYKPTENRTAECVSWVEGHWTRISTQVNDLTNIASCNISLDAHFAVSLRAKTQNVTHDLGDILNSSDDYPEKLSQVNEIITEFSGTLDTVDIAIISEILASAVEDFRDLKVPSEIVNNLMSVPVDVMQQSQLADSCTDKILHSFDQMAKSFDDDALFLYDDFQIISVSLRNTSITGLILDCEEKCQIAILYNESNISKIEETYPNFETIILFSEELLDQLRQSHNATFAQRLILAVYSTNAFFDQESATSKIFGILLPHFSDTFNGPISIYFNTFNSSADSCAFWDYDVATARKGRWTKDGANNNTDKLSQCDFNHVTHFALLLSDGRHKSFGHYFNQLLSTINTVTFVLSICGIFGILLTGVFFKSWRQNTGNQILLNFCLAISIKMIMMYVSESVFKRKSRVGCSIAGAILHYALLSEFCWMLIIAILQFKRFVEVLGGPPKFILIKACICCWFFPLLPVLTILLLDASTYSNNRVGLCYPSDLALYLGVWLPIIIIVTINIVIFFYIISNVCQKRTPCVETAGSNEKLFQWRLALLLFFMLGITWTFGLLSQIHSNIDFIFDLLFNVTASLQGFVMFLFFIVFNQPTRTLYVKGVQRWWYTKNFKSL